MGGGERGRAWSEVLGMCRCEDEEAEAGDDEKMICIQRGR